MQHSVKAGAEETKFSEPHTIAGISGFDCSDTLRGEDGWLKNTELAALTSPEEVVRTYRKHIKGLAVYDPAVPATSCIASTAAGCDELLPVRFSADGCGNHFDLAPRLISGVPTIREWEMSDSPEAGSAPNRVPAGSRSPDSNPKEGEAESRE